MSTAAHPSSPRISTPSIYQTLSTETESKQHHNLMPPTMTLTGSSSRAAARRESKAITSSRNSPPKSASLSVAAPPIPTTETSSSPESGSLSVALVDNSEPLLNYNGDIKDGLIDLLDHIEADEKVAAEEKCKTVELMHAVFRYVESCAQTSASESEMRETLKAVEVTFDDIVFRRDKGSPYQKVINWCAVQRAKKEKQQRQQARKQRDESA